MEKELLFSITKKDFNITYFSGKGAGGQYRNKHQNCVRLQHKDSGVLVTGQSNRDRQANLKEAFNNLLKDKKFKAWHKRKVAETLGDLVNIEDYVECELNNPDNLLIEVKENGKWIKE